MTFKEMAEDEKCQIQGVTCEPKEDNLKKMFEEPKCQLVDFNSLPEYLKDNEFILGYYRSEWPMKQTILSIFSIHNETLNVWTHLMGFVIFLALTLFTVLMKPGGASHSPVQCLPLEVSGHEFNNSARTAGDVLQKFSGWKLPQILIDCLPERLRPSDNLTNPCVLMNIKDDVTSIISPLLVKQITRWPFFAFLCGAMFCLLTSSVCHLVSCHSEQMSYIMLRLDYTGISSLIVTSFYPVVYYSFMCKPFFCNLYMGFITTFGLATVLVSFVSVFQTPKFRTVRALLFFCMGVSGLVPIIHKLVLFHDRPEVILSTGYELLMGAFYGLGVLVYATRIPERWKPGMFDVVGHSHQLFHILVIAGAYSHYLAGLMYLDWRDNEKC